MIETVILFLVLMALLCWWKSRRPNNYPPGPKPLPVLGNIFQIPPGHIFPTIDKWAKLYGPIIGISSPGELIVFVTGADTVLAALRKEEFQGRPDNVLLRERSFGKQLGIFFSNGEQWFSTRKFVVKHLRAFGKQGKENVIADEISRLLDRVKSGTTIQGTGIFGLSAVNVIWTIVANKRIDVNDEKSRKFLQNLFTAFRQGNTTGLEFFLIFPVLRHLFPKYKFALKVNYELHEYMRETIREHREILDPNNPLDLIDHYLVELDRNKTNPDSYFSEEDLILVGSDLFSAGSESTSNSIEFLLLYSVLYPEVQARMQAELDRVLGRSRKPVLDDKAELHYTMAVLSEVERINSVVPTNVLHLCTRDTTFGGYFIPKGTMISMNLRSLGHDPKYWKHPDEFNPERFLDAEGKYNKSPILHTFGLGQRTCIGEMIARNIIFLFTATFFEKFSISLPPGEPKPSTFPLPGFTTAPQPFNITVNSRY